MARTIDALLRERSRQLVGRDRERGALLRLVDGDQPLVVFVHGLAGVGKSTLVDAVAADARSAGVEVVQLDCRAVEPTEQGALDAIAAAGGVAAGDLEVVCRGLSANGARVLLVLDAYETLRLVDDWVRLSLVPSLGANLRVVLASRDAPVSSWPATFGRLFEALPISNLSQNEAEGLLLEEGISHADAARINRLARGHPLALRLSTAALAARPDLDLEGVTVRAVVEELTRLYLDGLEPGTRRALDAASVVRRPTRSLLGAMLQASAPDAFERLRQLPFVDADRDGLVLHDTVRETVAAALRGDDPVAYRTYRIAAWRQLRRELEEASPRELWRYTADMLYILENPLLREGFFPTTEHLYAVEAARPADERAMLDVVTRHETPGSVALIERWWEGVPESFRVARGPDSRVAAVLSVGVLDGVPYGVVDADPVASLWREHLRRAPLAPGQKALGVRCLLTLEGGEAPSPAQAACWIDMKRLYLALRPNLRRVYSVFRDLERCGPVLGPLGFEELPGSPVAIDGVEYHAIWVDFGPASVDGWLSRLVADELLVEEDGIVDLRRRQLRLDEERVDLTRIELDLLHYLEQREGQAVERRAILRDVWGYELEGSNVIEAAVSSLRRKLGARAWMIETVRGVGYRFRSRQP